MSKSEDLPHFQQQWVVAVMDPQSMDSCGLLRDSTEIRVNNSLFALFCVVLLRTKFYVECIIPNGLKNKNIQKEKQNEEDYYFIRVSVYFGRVNGL